MPNLAKAAKDIYQGVTQDMHPDPRLSEFLMFPGIGLPAVVAGGARDLVRQGMNADKETGDQPATGTRLSMPEERRFRSWIATNNIPFDPSTHSAFDMRGFFKAYQAGDPRAQKVFQNWQQRAQQDETNK